MTIIRQSFFRFFTNGIINQYVTHLKKCGIYPLKKALINNIFEGKNVNEHYLLQNNITFLLQYKIDSNITHKVEEFHIAVSPPSYLTHIHQKLEMRGKNRVQFRHR